jgi:hypothetical protein
MARTAQPAADEAIEFLAIEGKPNQQRKHAGCCSATNTRAEA